MSPEKALERFYLLLARTASPYEEEARTSALLACRLLQEYNLQVQAPVDTRTGVEKARDLNRAYRAKAKAQGSA